MPLPAGAFFVVTGRNFSHSSHAPLKIQWSRVGCSSSKPVQLTVWETTVTPFGLHPSFYFHFHFFFPVLYLLLHHLSPFRELCNPYIIRGDAHANRTALNKRPAVEATFPRGARTTIGGARRPQFMFDVLWEHTPGNRQIQIYTKVLNGAEGGLS